MIKRFAIFGGLLCFLTVLTVLSCSESSDKTCEGSGCDSATGYNGEEAPEGSPSGLGKLCESDDECAEHEADFCVIVPGSGGYCSFDDCTIDPNDCPGGYLCCEYNLEGNPRICLSPAKWDEYSDLLCTNAK